MEKDELFALQRDYDSGQLVLDLHPRLGVGSIILFSTIYIIYKSILNGGYMLDV
jgi:hypothetical protein